VDVKTDCPILRSCIRTFSFLFSTPFPPDLFTHVGSDLQLVAWFLWLLGAPVQTRVIERSEAINCAGRTILCGVWLLRTFGPRLDLVLRVIQRINSIKYTL